MSHVANREASKQAARSSQPTLVECQLCGWVWDLLYLIFFNIYTYVDINIKHMCVCVLFYSLIIWYKNTLQIYILVNLFFIYIIKII